MNHWIVLFHDRPEMLSVRDRHFADHLAYLARHADLFIDGTPLSPDEGAAPTGGLWIVRSDSRDAVVRLIEGDPMFQSGHRRFEIFATGKQLTVS